MCRRNKLSLVWTCAERCYLLSRRQSLVKRYYRETCGSHFCNSADCNARTMGERRYVRHKNEGRNNKFVRNVGHHTKGETFSHTYLLTPWCRLLLEKLTGLQLLKKFPAFHGTRRFITALTSVRHLSLSWASPIQSIYPHPTSCRSILILSTHLRLGLPSGLFPSCFPTKTLYTHLSSPIRATCPAHLILLDFITRTILGEQYKSFSSSLCNLLHSPVSSSLLGPNILLNTMFSNTLSFLSSRNVKDQASHTEVEITQKLGEVTLVFFFLLSKLN